MEENEIEIIKKKQDIVRSIDNVRGIIKELCNWDCDKDKCPIYGTCTENYNMGGYRLCDIFDFMISELDSSSDDD